MTTQSPQRARKSQMLSGAQGTPPREMSPSPTFRDRQRSIKAQSMPIVPSVSQIYGVPANSLATQRQGQQPSPTMMNISHQKRPSSPLMLQGNHVVTKMPSPPHPPSNMRDEMVQERFTPPPPPPAHALSQSNIVQHIPPPPPQHSHSQPNIHSHMAATNPQIGYPRPINRLPPPPFLNNFHTLEESWQMTDELMAEIERADLAQAMSQHPTAPGTSGVAYAGGAQSGAVYVRETSSPVKDDRMRGNERLSPKELDGGQGSGGSSGRRPVRVDREREVQPGSDSIRPRDRPLPASPAGSPQGQAQPQINTPERGSPQYHTPLGSSGEQSNGYNPYKRDSYQSTMPSQARAPTPPSLRRASNASTTETLRNTPPASTKYASQTPPLQAMKARTPDKSLPVQEEPEDDTAVAPKNGMNWVSREDYRRPHEVDRPGSPGAPENRNGHSQQYSRGERDSRAGPRDEDDDDTLIENESEDNIALERDRETEEESYTPRSPTANLPEEIPNRQYVTQVATNTRLPVIPKHRNGSTDQLGLRSFDPAVFAPPPKSKEESRESPTLPPRPLGTEQLLHAPESTMRSQQFHQYINHVSEQYEKNGRYHPPQAQSQDDANSIDDSTSAYIQSYIQSPRPNAPIPPTPHSQTAAPSPLISGMQTSPAPPAGSPYPYPFSHVRRSNTYSGYPVQPAPSSNYDPNHPSVIQEQLALQMQMYALNNHAAMSDSTFSPSSTPFPGAGYNPWAFLQASRAFGSRRGESTMSMQSSPSHEPVSLPFHSSKSRGLKRRERSSNLRHVTSARHKVQPPPRVESTQPRETSPEPSSSGEETAGEETYDGGEEGVWVDDGNAEWVDEDDEDKDDLLDLEYHPDYINNLEKRRRRWDSRWDALVQAFQALDRETDTTLVLLASPSHSTKLHAVTSRSIRRELASKQSMAMANIRTSFSNIATRRRATRAQGTSLVERLLLNANLSGESSDGSSESREGDLKRALETALGSLGALRGIYEQRVARWEDEMSRISDERERVDLLLKQTLGVGFPNGTDVRTM